MLEDESGGVGNRVLLVQDEHVSLTVLPQSIRIDPKAHGYLLNGIEDIGAIVLES
jgi:hypothetical protein